MTLPPDFPATTPVRPSGCPGLLRIVQAMDGGICRVKLAGGLITAQQAEAVADVAHRYASGVIEATNRSNLQIRGVGTAHHALIEPLLAVGLGPDLWSWPLCAWIPPVRLMGSTTARR